MTGLNKCNFHIPNEVYDLISKTEKLAGNQIELLFKEEIKNNKKYSLFPAYISAASRIVDFIPQILIINKSKFNLAALTHELFHLYLSIQGVWQLYSEYNDAANQFSMDLTNTIEHIIFFPKGLQIGIDFYNHHETSIVSLIDTWPMSSNSYVRFIDGIHHSIEMNFLLKNRNKKKIWKNKITNENAEIFNIAQIITNKIKHTNFDNNNEILNLYCFIIDKLKYPNINLIGVFKLFCYDFINKKIKFEII